MMSDLFKIGKIRVGVLSLLYMGAAFCALVIRRYHQEIRLADTPSVSIKPLPYLWLYFVLFAVFSVSYFVLIYRKGMDAGKRNIYVLTYFVTIFSILLLYKLVILLIELMLGFPYI